ncbi:annexin A4-like [Cotesia typhae]
MDQLVPMILISILLIFITDIKPVLSYDVDEHAYVLYRKSELDEIPKNLSKNNDTWINAAISLHDALQNDDHYEIIDILIVKNLFHRTSIADAYYNQFRTQLKLDVRSKLFRNFGNLMTALSTPELEFLIEEIHYAIYQYSEMNKNIFLDIFCRRNYMEIDKIKNAYPLYYGKELPEDLLNIPTGDFQSILIDFTVGILRTDAFWSFGFGSGKQSPSIYPRDPLSLCTEGVYDYYTKRLHESLQQKDHQSTTRLMVITVNEHTLHHIIERYKELYHVSLRTQVHHHTEGYFCKSLLILIDVVSRTDYLFK